MSTALCLWLQGLSVLTLGIGYRGVRGIGHYEQTSVLAGNWTCILSSNPSPVSACIWKSIFFFFAHKIAGNRSLPAFSPFAQMYYIDHLTWDTVFRTALFETSEISPRVNHNHSYFPLSINVHPSWVTEKEGKELASLPPHSRVSEGFKMTDFLECLHIVYTPFIPWLISHYLQKMFMKIERPGFMLSHLSFVTLDIGFILIHPPFYFSTSCHFVFLR